MKISARNMLAGKILRISEGSVNSEVVIEVAPGVEIVSIVTRTSVASLGLKVGGKGYAVIKASSVMLAVD